MKIAQFSQSQKRCIGVEVNGSWLDYSRAGVLYSWLTGGVQKEPVVDLGLWIQSGTFDPAEVRKTADFILEKKLESSLIVDRAARLQAPVGRPPKIIALGLNYALHAAEGKFKVPEEPIIFAKAGSSVIGPGEAVLLPKGMGRIDHEVELAVIIGKKARSVRRKDAYKYVAGYTIANDVSARDLQAKDLEKKHPWFRSKSFDTFTPMGPWMITADEIHPPVHLDLQCTVNGTIRQQANTRDMVFDVPAQIEFISRYITLEPGDVISTGTPEGIGPIRPGDTMACDIEKIGELKNPVKAR